MPSFDYDAIDNSGRSTAGQVSADSEKEAIRSLISRDLTPISISQQKTKNTEETSWFMSQKPKEQDFILAIKQLALLITSGVPLITAVDTLKTQSPHPNLISAFNSLAKNLRSGVTFGEAFKKALPDLPSYVFQLISAGESIGELGSSLKDASSQLEYEYRIKQDIKTALTYPFILIIAGLSAIIFIFLVVVPRFSAMVSSSNQELPFLSELVLSSGMFLSQNKLGMLFISIFLFILITWALKNPNIRESFKQLVFRFPLIGSWIKESELAKWSSMLSTMLKNGVDLVKALEFAQGTMNINSMRNNMVQVSKLVRNGNSLSQSMKEQETFSDTALSLIQVGEESGELAHMLSSLATLYEESGRQRMKRFLLFLEPAAIILIGLVIGVIVTAIMLAITSINQINI